MRFFSFAVVAALVAPILAGPIALKTVETAKQRKEGSYIITLKPNVQKAAHLDKLQGKFRGTESVVSADWDADFLNGFAAKLTPEALKELRADPDVASISEDGIMSITTTQTNAPWGLQRISQRAKLSSTSTSALTYTYNYDSKAGSGVDVYVVDTGINTAHVTFGGRARWGTTFGGYANQDGNGHGTHCAGTVGGAQYGVAKAASLIAVKVLSDSGSGTNSDVISGLNWVATQARASGRPSIVSMSLGGGASTAVDSAVSALTAAGVHVVVAAGNDNTNAANSSPARVASAITVGASTITDTRASFSNYGAVVDVFAPGQNIISAWMGSSTATNNISGTSMATPHVAGLAAYLISVSGNRTPSALSSYIVSLSTKSALSGLPSGTANQLAYNGIA